MQLYDVRQGGINVHGQVHLYIHNWFSGLPLQILPIFERMMSSEVIRVRHGVEAGFCWCGWLVSPMTSQSLTLYSSLSELGTPYRRDRIPTDRKECIFHTMDPHGQVPLLDFSQKSHYSQRRARLYLLIFKTFLWGTLGIEKNTR